MNRNANLIYAPDSLSNPRFSVFPGDSPAVARETLILVEEMRGLGDPVDDFRKVGSSGLGAIDARARRGFRLIVGDRASR